MIPAKAARMDPYYEDEWVTIYHADCRELIQQLWFNHRQLTPTFVTDPPYGIDHHSNARRLALPTGIEGDDDTATRDAALAAARQAYGRDVPALVFGSWRRPRPEGTRMRLVWDTLGANGQGDTSLPWKPASQEIYVLGRGFVGKRTSDVLRYPPVQSTAKNGRVHPHEKPVDLMRDLVAKCPPGVVIDPFMGSGPTLRAAKDLGRRSIGVDIDERYCKLAVARMRQEVLRW